MRRGHPRPTLGRRHACWLLWGGLVAAASVVAAAPSAQAAPVVRVKARTDVKMMPVVIGDSGGILVRGELLDQVTKEPLPSQVVEVSANGYRRRVRTDRDGQFAVHFDIDADGYDIDATFVATEHLAASTARMSDVTVEKQNLVLDLVVEDPALTGNTIDVTVRARAAGGGAVEVPIELYVGDGDELSYLAELRTDARGGAARSIERRSLGSLGRKRLVARFTGDVRYNPAETYTELLLSTSTRLTLALASTAIAYEDTLDGEGVLADENEVGVAGATVSLLRAGRPLVSALTDGEGRFRMRVPGAELGPGTVSVQAAYEPLQSWYRDSRSGVVAVTVAEPRPVPIAHTLAAFGATAMAMLAFLGLRTRPWQGWLARMRRSEDAQSKDDATKTHLTVSAPIRGGVKISRTGLVAGLRRPHVYSFTGMVRDAVTARPVVSEVSVDCAGERLAQSCTGSGGFEFKDLAAGVWQVLVQRDGYVSERFAVPVPHRGEYTDTRVDLVPVRERIFSMYRELAEPLLPDPEKWGIWTPRQIFEHVRRRSPASALSELTDFVEENYFSQRTPLESILTEAEAHIERARSERLAVMAS
ncbi:carboxypeptidase-like regulatory domain-containing protein [Haliangium sp.]|uniref:carboxypeptidase-like regulatory domain-containing protein n=1 Tax=Haliangium sp. TaxID=2663208 RepID=UPI003D110AA9